MVVNNTFHITNQYNNFQLCCYWFHVNALVPLPHWRDGHAAESAGLGKDPSRFVQAKVSCQHARERMANHTGITPPSDPSGRFRSSPEFDTAPSRGRVPAASVTITTEEPRRHRGASARGRELLDRGAPSSSSQRPVPFISLASVPKPSQPYIHNPIDPNMPAAAFVAGAAIQEANQAAQIAHHAASMAEHQAIEAMRARQLAAQAEEHATHVHSQAQFVVHETRQQAHHFSQRMVEESRLSGVGMPCGRVMLATVFRHFQLEKDRIGMLGERNLLTLKLKGNKTEDLITFQEKYRYILAAIPSEDLPRETTLLNHLLDELEQFAPLAAKIAKSRESPLGSHRRSTKWLWEKVDLHIELERVKANRQAFDKKLRDSHTADLATSYSAKAIPANPAKTDKPKKEKSKEDKKKEKNEKKEKAKKEKQQQPLQQPVDVHAAPGPKSKAPKGPPKAKPRGHQRAPSRNR